jgi:hypothetical protein
MLFPSGLNAADHTPLSRRMGGSKGLPLAVSQSRAAPSRPPVRGVLPSGLNATALIWPSCRMGSPRGMPETAFQSRMVIPNLVCPTPLKVTMVLPSGLSTT